MTLAENAVERVECAGGVLALNGARIRVRLPADAAHLLEELRANKDEVISLLRSRQGIPALPPGVRLIGWNLKQPPVALETCAVVTDPALFARTTLEQLETAVAQPKRWIGWSIAQLIDRLAQVGVAVAVESIGIR
jgi:hypothetical protein